MENYLETEKILRRNELLIITGLHVQAFVCFALVVTVVVLTAMDQKRQANQQEWAPAGALSLFFAGMAFTLEKEAWRRTKGLRLLPYFVRGLRPGRSGFYFPEK